MLPAQGTTGSAWGKGTTIAIGSTSALVHSTQVEPRAGAIADQHGTTPDDTATTVHPPRDASSQAQADPLVPTAADGWSPATSTVVHSRSSGGFYGSALRFTFGGVEELPGQRLSVAQVDALAPYFAHTYELDEEYVRRELSKVYIYVGGPSTTAGQAMTIGHHIYVPDEPSLDRITTPRGKRWLVHELAHTMQFLSFHDASPQSFLADYFTSMVVGRDPDRPGAAGGDAVWGALFTGLRSAGHTQDELGKGAVTTRQRLGFSVLPAAVIGLPVALVGAGALSAARAKSGLRLLGGTKSVAMMMGVLAGPMLLGGTAGTYSDHIGHGTSQLLGATAGGLVAGATLWHSGAFSVGSMGARSNLGRAIGSKAGLALAIGGVAAGAALGWLTARTSANSISGWSANAELLNDILHPADGCATCVALKELTLQNALHDAHWMELDAETVAQQFVRGGWTPPADGKPIEGRVPDQADASLGDRISADISDRIDWGVKVPLLLGIPAAGVVGAGVHTWRTGHTLIDSTIRQGKGPTEAVRDAFQLLGSQNRGWKNSLGLGAAVTIAPLVVGGIVGPIAYNVSGSGTAARIAGAGASAIVTSGLVAMLMKGRVQGKLSIGMGVLGVAASAAIGMLAAGVATDALKPNVRQYDTSFGARAAEIPAIERGLQPSNTVSADAAERQATGG